MPTRTAADLNPRYTFETFVTGRVQPVRPRRRPAVAETPARSYNPLFIYGAAGLGQDAPLHAIGHYVTQNYAHYQVRYVTTETFLNEYVDAIRTNSAPCSSAATARSTCCSSTTSSSWRARRGSRRSSSTRSTPSTGPTSRSSSRRTACPTPSPRSRTACAAGSSWGLITDIQPPDLETRLAILRKKAEREHSPVPDDVLEFIATHITDNIRELEGALIRVSAYASLNRVHAQHVAGRAGARPTSWPTRQPRPITPTLILDKTVDMFGFSVEDDQRQEPAAAAGHRPPDRHVRVPGAHRASYPAIAREFGGRDHTTVIHAVEKVTALMKERQQIYDQVTELPSASRAARDTRATRQPRCGQPVDDRVDTGGQRRRLSTEVTSALAALWDLGTALGRHDGRLTWTNVHRSTIPSPNYHCYHLSYESMKGKSRREVPL